MTKRKIVLITQEEGHLATHSVLPIDKNKTTQYGHDGNRSCGLIEHSLRQEGYEVVQLKLCDLRLQEDRLLYKEEEINDKFLKGCVGVVKRTWSGDAETLRGADVQQWFENKGLVPNNPAAAMRISNSKSKTTELLQKADVPHPRSLIVRSGDDDEKIRNFLSNVDSNRTEYPVVVVKKENGTHGKGCTFLKKDELMKLPKIPEEETGPYVLQEYVVPALFNPAMKGAHKRVIISKNATDEYKFISGFDVERSDSWASNTSDIKDNTTLIKTPIHSLTREIEAALKKAATEMGLNEFGADIVTDVNGKAFVLEFNDGQRLSGGILELRSTAQQCMTNFVRRIEKEKNLTPPGHWQAKIAELSAKTRSCSIQ
jgi:glutathione synthase/RimK-type ligase-like ATP-grasp enzyme